MNEWDKEFYNMLDHVKEVHFNMVQEWCRLDPFRVEALASAMAYDEITFWMRWAFLDPEDSNVLLDKTFNSGDEYRECNYSGYDRVSVIKRHLECLPEHFGFTIDAPSLKKWLNKTFPLKPEQVLASALPFMSDQLARAVQFSNELYPDGYKDTGESLKVQKDRESARIKKHLKNKNLSTRVREALTVQLNPVK